MIASVINAHLQKYCEVYFYVKRSLIDSEQLMGSVESVVRTKLHGAKVYEEKQVAWILSVIPRGPDRMGITNWCVWIDPVWHVTLNSLETPLPHEVWSPIPTAVPSCREEICNIIIRKVKAYSHENVHDWAQCVHNDVIMHPPWDTLIGLDACKKAVHVYLQNYKHTQITPLQLLYDETQPNFAVYQQLFKTTNKITQEEGEDRDFVFLEVVDGKIRYWRTYFDTTSSAQKPESTFRQVFSKALNRNSPPLMHKVVSF